MRVLGLLAILSLAACGGTPAAPRTPTPTAVPAPGTAPPPFPSPPTGPPPATEEREPPEDPGRPHAAPGEDPDFPAKTPPRPRDWLAVRSEPGQTAAEYRAACRNRRSADRARIVIQPLGAAAESHGGLLEKAREYAGLFYGVEATIAPAMALPAGALDRSRGQVDGDGLLAFLGARRPRGALAYVGFCGEDLYSGDLNFVFGVADPFRRSGVYSLARYGGDGEEALLRRTLKVATHEIGHLLGMEHCVRYECLLNGVNHLAEADSRPTHLCPECQEKARWNCGFDPGARWEALAGFYGRNALAPEAEFARRRAAKETRGGR